MIMMFSVRKMKSVALAPSAARVVRRGKGIKVELKVWEGMLLAVMGMGSRL